MPDTSLSFAEVEVIYLRHRDELERHLRRYVRCHATASDLAQDLYLRLARIADRFPTEEDAKRFLFRMATNLALDHRRVHSNRHRLLEGVAALEGELVVDSVEVAEMRDLLNDIGALLDGLPERRRTIFTQARVLGMTYGEIAQAHGVSVSLIEKEVASVLRTLVNELDSAPQHKRSPTLALPSGSSARAPQDAVPH